MSACIPIQTEAGDKESSTTDRARAAVPVPPQQSSEHSAPRSGHDWREDDYRAALRACGCMPTSSARPTAGDRSSDEPSAGPSCLLPSAISPSPSQCRPAYQKQLFNNLGVILVQKHAPSGQEASSDKDRRGRVQGLAEAVELLRGAVSLQPDWPEAQHNLGSAIAAHAHALEAL